VRALERAEDLLNRLVTVDAYGSLFRGKERIDLFELGLILRLVKEALETYEQE